MTGQAVVSASFGGKNVTIYERGFVKVAGLLSLSAPPEKLLTIEATSDVGKKSGPGRAAGAMMTGGLNLLTSNKRGDVYLLISTDKNTYVLHETPPTTGT